MKLSYRIEALIKNLSLGRNWSLSEELVNRGVTLLYEPVTLPFQRLSHVAPAVGRGAAQPRRRDR